MPSRLVGLLFVLLLLATPATRAQPAAAPAHPAAPPVAELGLGDALALGIVEGVTEFLPISSTGHLIIANRFLGLESAAQLRDRAGRPLWHRPPSPAHPAGEPLTLKLAADTYAVVIQVGAIAAVVLLYRAQFVALLLGLLGRSADGRRLLRNVLLAFAPVAALGFVAHGWVDRHLFSVEAVIAALVAGAVLMLWAERWRRTHGGRDGLEPVALPARSALGIGLAQCLALWPGTSRSMVTIVAGYVAGLSPVRAAEFSFLVGLPTLAGAAFLKSWKSGAAMIEVFGWSRVLLGGAVAALAAAVAVRFLVAFLARRGLVLFACYRLALAAVLAAVWWW